MIKMTPNIPVPIRITRALASVVRFAEPRHRYGVAAGFAERRREDLNNPE